MKKFLALLLAALFVLAMSAVALAAEVPEPADPSVTVNMPLEKVYQLTNADTTSPAEGFAFTITSTGVTDSTYTTANMPAFSPNTFTVSFAEGGAAVSPGAQAGPVTAPSATYEKVGIFYYTITETAGSTAGVTYNADAVIMKVTVEELNGALGATVALRLSGDDEAKIETVTNTYSAGSLDITKTVTGNMGEKDRYFEVKVTLTAPEGKTVPATVGVSGGSNAGNPATLAFGTETTFLLMHGETIIFANIPYDVTYGVTETDYSGDGYTTTIAPESGTIAAASQSVAITNDKAMEVDTGISLDDAPYWILIGVVVLAGAAFLMKRRLSGRRG